ncbi:MAG: hypothetical protein JWQ09_601 [Segetibacter sp.]|nr:hypothetical protein [Segetibacter sp.]
MRRLAIISLLIIFNACSLSPVPKGILEPEKMQKVVYDLIRIDEFINNFVIKDSTIDIKKKRSTLYEQVFKVNNTTRKEFYASYKYYQRHPDVQKGLFDSLYENLNRKKVEVGKDKPGKPGS